jgi:hypothetical protein
MQPLSNEEEEESKYDNNIYISGSGTVSSTNAETFSFVIHATQYISGGDRSDDIAICGRMNKSAKWPKPLELLPKVHSIIYFRGILDNIGSYTPPNSKKSSTCMYIAMEDITFLFTPSTTMTKQATRNIRQKIEARTKKRKNSPSSSQTQSQTSSLPSTSQKTLGKRKANSEDEVDNNIKPTDYE